MVGTIYKNIFSKEPHYLSVDKLLERIKTGVSKSKVLEIREQMDKERANELKKNLPSVCFSGKFGADRTDNSLIEHSGFVVLDLDEITNVEERKSLIASDEYVYAVWVSPRANGLKFLVKIADHEKHKEHFAALQDRFSGLDRSGINISRVCYESFDEHIFINPKAKVWKKIKTVETAKEQVANVSSAETFKRILVWLTNRGDAFVKGERNLFVYKLASACCRFGISQTDCENLSFISLGTANKDFSERELTQTIKSAYKSNAQISGTAEFTNDILVDRVSKKEVETKDIDLDLYNPDVKPKDVIYGEDCKAQALQIYENGHEGCESMGIPELDHHFKMKRGEITLLSGHGNYGKSTFLKYILLIKILKTDKRFAFFSPEENPAHEFYHDIVEMYLGQNMTPSNSNRPSRDKYEEVYDFISKRIFYVYPKDIAPTPEYIKERFLELIIKEKVDGCVIDPFNQLSNDYKGANGRTDKYLETFLSDCIRFAQDNNVFFIIVAHPKGGFKKDDTGNYPCPDVYDIADGAMWNNKMDNILIYHRPYKQSDPLNTEAEFHSKKIRRQKIVGACGDIKIELGRATRRFYFGGRDYLAEFLAEIDKEIIAKYGVELPLPKQKPVKDFYDADSSDGVAPF